MNLSLFWSNLKSSRGGLIAWGVILFVYGVLLINLYSSLKNAPGLQSYYESLPPELRTLIYGAGWEKLGPIFSPEGIINFDAWLSTEYINFWPVLLAVYAIFSAGGMVAREVERGTMDLLLSQPLPRYRVLITKFATILVGLCIIALFSMVGIYLGISIVNAQANEWGILLALVQGIFMLIAIASYSALFSCLFLSPRTTLTTSGVLTGASYIINVTATSLGPLSWTQKLSLFYYFRPLEVIHTSRLDGTGLGIYLAVSIVCLALALVIFERKDIVF